MAGILGKAIRPRIAYDSVRAVHGPSAGEHSGLLFLNNNECLIICESV
jgi:hypothetical protein